VVLSIPPAASGAAAPVAALPFDLTLELVASEVPSGSTLLLSYDQ
jgi:hypothetical protein